ncbi:hypothetical protein QBC33DRAFT_554855 [Phialemonium atrogriseum]|uniref:Glycosyltransferase family 31 protein n=1 Tax=Phialemonium atrogriseum TaxID=1093897 RepID=A0AAJ0CAL3_9PEZI|nr:uncharacterized protein QBC33DRAFT_554855 [Phialemonium atrogriseum]KAK1771694.1 hypothetical protein QBC33DRAFT_554855 [Phialemonium atrogriseum]
MHIPRVLLYCHAKAIRAVIVVLTCTSLLLTLRLSTSQPKQPSIYDNTEGRTSPWHDWRHPNKTSRPEEVAFLEYLVHTYGLTNEVPWYARRIKSSSSARRRMSMTEVPIQFMPHDFTRARVDDENLELRAEKSIKLPVTSSPRGHQVDATALLFGISTTYSRLIYANNSLISDWERWLTDGNGNSNGASLLVTLHRARNDEVERASSLLRSLGIDATVLRSVDDGDATSRYVELVHLLREYSEGFGGGEGAQSKRYLALVDDDVFFPSMSKLVDKLSKFHPSKEYYIGAPSDRSDWIVENNKTFTCGGGAVFLTLPMAEKFSQLPCLDLDGRDPESSTAKSAQWDFSLYDCVTSHSSAVLQVLPSYHAPGDDEAYGDRTISSEGYGAGIRPLTLHHYKNWHRFEAGKGHLVTSACGEDCFLQRFRFRDDWILVNGYAISHYPDGVDALPLRSRVKTPPEPPVAAATTTTRRAAAAVVAMPRKTDAPSQKQRHDQEDGDRVAVGSGLVVDRPDRPSDMKVVAWRGRKRVWRLLDARVGEGGEVWQAYVKRRGGGNWFGDADPRLTGDKVHAEEEKSDVDSVIVLIWEA